MFSNVRFDQFFVIRDKYLTTVTEPFKHLNFFTIHHFPSMLSDDVVCLAEFTAKSTLGDS
jgi:hypothetical protein